jgi:hypothetical protein
MLRGQKRRRALSNNRVVEGGFRRLFAMGKLFKIRIHRRGEVWDTMISCGKAVKGLDML